MAQILYRHRCIHGRGFCYFPCWLLLSSLLQSHSSGLRGTFYNKREAEKGWGKTLCLSGSGWHKEPSARFSSTCPIRLQPPSPIWCAVIIAGLLAIKKGFGGQRLGRDGKDLLWDCNCACIMRDATHCVYVNKGMFRLLRRHTTSNFKMFDHCKEHDRDREVPTKIIYFIYIPLSRSHWLLQARQLTKYII